MLSRRPMDSYMDNQNVIERVEDAASNLNDTLRNFVIVDDSVDEVNRWLNEDTVFTIFGDESPLHAAFGMRD